MAASSIFGRKIVDAAQISDLTTLSYCKFSDMGPSN